MACGRGGEVQMHHFVRRWKLSKREVRDERFQVPLCVECHTRVHGDAKCSGMAFYDRHGMLYKLTLRCQSDPRWLMQVEGHNAKKRT